MSSTKWLMWTRKSFKNSSNGIATFLPRRIRPWCIAGHDGRSSKWHPWPTMWHAWRPLIFMRISTRTLRRHNCSRGSWAKRASWWPSGSSAAGTTIRPLGSSFIADLLNLLLLYTKSQADSLVMVDRVSTKWFLARNLEPKLCTSIPLSPNPMFGSWTRKIVDGTIFIWLWTANPNGAAWFPPHNLATTVCGNREQCHNNAPPPLPMLSSRGAFLTFFVNEDHTALTNFRRFVAPQKLDCFLCCVYGDDGNVRHPSPNCPLLLNSSQLGCLPDSIVDLSQLKTFRLWRCHNLTNLPMEFGKLQSLVELDVFSCSQLRCLLDSIVHLSQLKTFQLGGCDNLMNLPMEFGKLQSLVELDLFGCSQLGCLPDSIVHLSQLKRFQLGGCHNLTNLPMEFGKLQSLVELDLSSCSQLGCLPDSIVHLSQLKRFQLGGCHNLTNLPMEFGKLQSLVELGLSGCSQLGCLPYSIVHLSQLNTFRQWGCHNLTNLPMEFGKLQSLVELDLFGCSQLGCLPDSIVHLSQLKRFQL